MLTCMSESVFVMSESSGSSSPALLLTTVGTGVGAVVLVLAGLIARRPRILVLDEPLAGLDPPGRDDIIGVLAGLRDLGIPLVSVSTSPTAGPPAPTP